jgi:regulator of sigma E protease
MDFNWLWIVPVLGLLVLVHEAGHFFTARAFGIRVEEFGIGLPPRAFAIRRNGIDYSINWLPIGGFVKILGENGDSDAPDSFGKAPAWQRIVVLVAGVTMNMLTAVILFFLVFTIFGKTVEGGVASISGVQDGGPAAAAGLKPDDLVLAVNGQPITSSEERPAIEDLKRLLDAQRGKETMLTVDRNGSPLDLHVTPRADTGQPALGVTLLEQRGPLTVQSVDPASTAYKNGLRTGDRLLAVNGHNVPTIERLNGVLTNAKGQATVDLLYQRNGETQPAIRVELSNSGLVGVVAVWPSTHIAYTLGEAVTNTLNTTWSILTAIPQALAQVVRGQAPANSLAGPIGIAQITGEVSRESGLQGLLSLTALLGINLALINILPLPALDGGRILFILIEILRGGRKIAPEKEAVVHLVGMVLLLLLIALISIGDIGRLLQGVSFLPK